MATWYGPHIAQAANSEGGPDGEALVLELWELLALRVRRGALGCGGDAFVEMPWHQHLREPLGPTATIQDRARSRAAPRLVYYRSSRGLEPARTPCPSPSLQ